MADYIDREAFRAVLQKSHRYHAGNCREVSLLSRDIRLLNEHPAADVSPVVRCKNCKHWHEQTGFCGKHSYFVDDDGLSCSPHESPNWTMWAPDNFCSSGELREGSSNA